MTYRPPPEYHSCYPDAQIDTIVRAAKEGIENIGIVTATSTHRARVRDSLNEAWRVFWTSPSQFGAWEADEVGKLLPIATA